jgi:hypothetical protein
VPRSQLSFRICRLAQPPPEKPGDPTTASQSRSARCAFAGSCQLGQHALRHDPSHRRLIRRPIPGGSSLITNALRKRPAHPSRDGFGISYTLNSGLSPSGHRLALRPC